MTRTLMSLLACLALAGLLAGCGNKDERPRAEADTEGPYIEVAGLTYQVQMSRQLNAADAEDQQYLIGLPATVRQPSGDEAWFGVWLRVENQDEEETRQPARDFEIVDTQEERFRPVTLDPAANPFVYDPRPLAPKALIPEKNSAAETGPIQGSLILFRIPSSSFQNRPLEFRIAPPTLGEGEAGVINLDV